MSAGGVRLEFGAAGSVKARGAQRSPGTSCAFPAAGEKSSKIVKDNTFKVYPGAPHGLSMVAPFKDVFDADLLAFARG
jgi:hypothetical protein